MSPNLKDKLKLGILLLTCILILGTLGYFLFGPHHLVGITTPYLKVVDAKDYENKDKDDIVYKFEDNGKYYLTYSHYSDESGEKKHIKSRWDITKELYDKLESGSYYYLDVKFYKNDNSENGNVIRAYENK